MYNLVDGYQHFGGIWYFHHTPKEWQLFTVLHSIASWGYTLGISDLIGFLGGVSHAWV
jgi:hypothetical protein